MHRPDDRLVFLVLVLAVYRLARALTVDAIADPLRTRIAARYGLDSSVGQLTQCPHCAGVWFAAVTVVAAWAFGLVRLRAVPFLIAAVAGGQSLLASAAETLGQAAATLDEAA